MSPLLLRELRRLAPYGLGSAALILAAFPASWAGGARAEALACAALLGPAVLGVATVAPSWRASRSRPGGCSWPSWAPR